MTRSGATWSSIHWTSVAVEFGDQAERVISQARERVQQRTEELPVKPRNPAQEAVTFAKERGFEREAVTDERDLLCDALRRGMGELTLPGVRENFNQRRASGEFQSVEGQKHETGRQFTTRETITAERATIGYMKQGQNTVEPIMKNDEAKAHAASREFLNPSQPERQTPDQIDQRHYAPIQSALRDEANGYDWKRETGDIQSYQHKEHHGWLHIDPQGFFYDRQATRLHERLRSSTQITTYHPVQRPTSPDPSPSAIQA